MKLNQDISATMLQALGFSNHVKDVWYFCKDLGGDISFNISVTFDGEEAKGFAIDVLDEDYLQPYDF